MVTVKPMNGILVIDKPTGISSHDCVNIVRRTYSTKKVGHSGTLDVEASGVLILGVNKGTKLLNYLNQDDKAYEFSVQFGVTTDTLDHSGTVTDTSPVDQLADFDHVLESFKGAYSQMPPAYSAVKVKGKKLYEYARNQETIPDVQARDLIVYALKKQHEIVYKDGLAEVKLYVKGSKGIYVRKLAEDLATRLNTIAHTTRIHRVQAGDFTIDDAVKLDAITSDTPLISLSDALKSIPAYRVSEKQLFAVSNGQKLTLNHDADLLKMVNEDGKLLAIYAKENNTYKAKNVFV